MEYRCGEGGKAKNAREGEILPKSIVRSPSTLQIECVCTDIVGPLVGASKLSSMNGQKLPRK